MRSSKACHPSNRLLLLTASGFFVWILIVFGMTASPAEAALILAIDRGDTSARGEPTFSLSGGPLGETYDLAGTSYGFTFTVDEFPYRIIDQGSNRFRFDLSQDFSIFARTEAPSRTALPQSDAPVMPLSSLPSSVLLFMPTLVGILGIALQGRSSIKKLARGVESQPSQIPSAHSRLILILSPDITFAKDIERQLCRAGYLGRVVSSVNDLLTIAHHSPLSLVLVDHRVGDWDVLRTDSRLRHVPMIALIPPGSLYTEENCLTDLERGMDGTYDTRDGHRLLMAKVGAYLRRAGHEISRRGLYRIGAVELDTDIREVKVGQRRIELSAKPFALLEAFMRAPSKVFSRGELIDLVWGPNFAIGDHTLDVHVHALRQVLQQDPDHLCRLTTIKGVGFKLKAVSPAVSLSEALPMAVNSLPLLRPSVVHASSNSRSIAASTLGSRRPRLRPVPRQRRDRSLRRERSVRHLRTAMVAR